MTLNPTFIDFSATPPRTANATAEAQGANNAGNHWIIGAGGAVRVRFAGDGQSDEVTLKIRALVSKAGSAVGHAPLDVVVNGRVVIERFRIPGGGDLPQTMTFVVPGDWLAGENTLELRSAADSGSMLWLYDVLLESVWDRDAAERAMLTDGAKESAFTYDTYHSDGDEWDWEPAPRLRLWIDEGQAAIPGELTWRGRDGSEGAVTFAREMDTFLGHVRAADGRWSQFRGDLVERTALPAEPGRRFETDVSWDGDWHEAGELGVSVDTGCGPLERLGWRDQRGNLASIGLADDGASFLGYAQHVNEGPIGYRGTLVRPDGRHE
jgi:hypothetical protein